MLNGAAGSAAGVKTAGLGVRSARRVITSEPEIMMAQGTAVEPFTPEDALGLRGGVVYQLFLAGSESFGLRLQDSGI